MREHFAAEYAGLDRWHWWFEGRRRVLEDLIRRRLEAPGPRTIVSLGSGHPEGLRWLERFSGGGGRVIGLDADPTGALRASAPAAGGIGFAIANIHEIPLAPATVDVVLALDVLEHVEEDVEALRAAAGLLRPDGLLLVTVPALMSLWGAQDVVSGHVRRYSRRTLRHTFRTAGLPEPEIGYFNFFLFPPIAAIRCARRLLPGPPSDRSDFEGARPGPVNHILARIFAAERRFVGRVPFPIGVSLYALLHVRE